MKETQVINRIETGKRIHRLRVENGYQVTDIQRVIGLASPQSVYKWEWGTTFHPLTVRLFWRGSSIFLWKIYLF